MARERKLKWGTSSLLNKEGYHSVAAIATTFEIGTWSDGSVDCEMSISDCSNTVNLDFSYNNDDEYKNSIHKVNVLLEEITKVKEHLEKYPMEEVTRIAKEHQAKLDKEK